MAGRRTRLVLPRAAAALGATALALFLPGGAPGVVLPPADFPQLVRGAESIVIGRVTGVTSRLEEDQRLIFTYVDIDIGETLKGGSRKTVTLKLGGGRDPSSGKSMVVFGVPPFRKGEKTCVFISPDRNIMCPIMGWENGKFGITLDAETGQETVTDAWGNPLDAIMDGKVIRAHIARGRRGEILPGKGRRLTLQTFKEEVRRHLK